MIKNKKLLIGLVCLAFCVCCAVLWFSFLGKNNLVAQADTISEAASNCSVYGWNTISLVSEGTHFTSKDFTVNYEICGTANVLNIDTEQNGIDVISETVRGNSIFLELEYDYNEEEHFIIIDVLTTVGDILTAKLYAIDTDCGIFIGSYSINQAYENYLDYAEPAGLISVEESQSLRKKLYNDTVIEDSYILPAKENDKNSSIVSTLANKDTYVKGKLQWKDDSGVLHPLRRAMVRIYDEEPIGETLIGTTYTDDSGNYSFTFQNKDSFWDFENGGLDIFVRVYAGDSNIMVKDASNNEYYYESDDVSKNMATGTTKTWNLTIEMVQDTTKDAVKGQAFQISQAILTARDYAKTMMGTTPSNVSIYYPSGDHAYYYSSSKSIHITGNLIDSSKSKSPQPYASWDMIMHEYGHHFQVENNITDNPGSTHYIPLDMAEHYYEDSVNDSLCKDCQENHAEYLLSKKQCKDYGIRIAWGEGVANVFSLMAQQFYRSVLGNINTVGDSNYESFNLKGVSYDMETNSFEGECNESVVCSILWDLFDNETQIPSVVETFDKFNLGHQALWNLVISSKATTLSQFINYIYETNYLDINDLASLLNQYKLTASNISYYGVSFKDLPTILWDIGGTAHYRQNKFIVVFYNEYKTELFRTSDLENTNFYKLTVSNWNLILQKTKNFYFSVWTYQDDGYCLTGPYISEYIQVDTPKTETLYVDTTVSGEIAFSGDYHWYKFIAPSSGTYSFYTEGTTDTYGDLFNNSFYGLGTENRLAYDDDSGENLNFQFVYNLYYNQVVYLRVRGYGYAVAYKVGVKFIEHIHSYWVRYEMVDEVNHKVYCDCGEYKLSNHNMQTYGNKVRCLDCGFMYALGGTVPGGGIQSVGEDTYNLCLANVKNQIIAYPNKQFH